MHCRQRYHRAGVTASPNIVTVIAYRTSQLAQCTSADCSPPIPSGVCVSVVPHPHSNVSGSPGIPAHYKQSRRKTHDFSPVSYPQIESLPKSMVPSKTLISTDVAPLWNDFVALVSPFSNPPSPCRYHRPTHSPPRSSANRVDSTASEPSVWDSLNLWVKDRTSVVGFLLASM